MALSKDQKMKVVEEINSLLSNSSSLAISDYKGLSVSEITNLRKELRNDDITYKVAKKTLINKVLVDNGRPALPEDIMAEAQVAIAFNTGDEITPFRILAKSFKKLKKGKLIGGLIEDELFGEEKAKKLADMPSKEELIAKMIGGFKSPLTKFHGVLSNTVGGFVRVLDAIKEKHAEGA